MDCTTPKNPVGFSGVVSDLEDPPEDLLITWSSSIDGVLVFNESPSNDGELAHAFILSQGDHTLSLSVEDRFGHVVQAEQSITVLPANEAPLCSITTPKMERYIVRARC